MSTHGSSTVIVTEIEENNFPICLFIVQISQWIKTMNMNKHVFFMGTWHFLFSPYPDPALALTCYIHNPWTISMQPSVPPLLNLLHQFLSSQCSHFPERFQGIIALTNHPLGSGAHEIDVPSFQNNGGALWGASWCHNFSSWQAGQVYFGPRMGNGPMKTLSGQLNQLPHRGGWQDCGVSSHQTCSITFSELSKLTAFFLGNQASLSP